MTRPRRPGNVSSMREPSMSATKRPHSWILAFVHWPIRQPQVDGPYPCRDSKDTERTGKGDRTVRASSDRDHGLVIDRKAAKEQLWNPRTSRPTALVTRPSTRGTSWP